MAKLSSSCSYFFIFMLLVSLAFMVKATKGTRQEEKHHFVLVHGASHGGWCWYKLITLLEKGGFRASAVDLSGAGISLSDPNSVLGPDDYNRPLFSFFSALSSSQVILVGHSVGGSTVTEALCKFSDKISMAVYIAADMTRPGSSPPPAPNPCLRDPNNEDGGIWDCTYGEGEDKPPTSIIMKKQYIRRYYYNLSPQEDVALASMLLRPAPLRALHGLGRLPAKPEAEKIPRAYVKTAKDNLFDPPRQDLMVKIWPPTRFYVLNESDHSSFFSAPNELFKCLVDVVSFLESK